MKPYRAKRNQTGNNPSSDNRVPRIQNRTPKFVTNLKTLISEFSTRKPIKSSSTQNDQIFASISQQKGNRLRRWRERRGKRETIPWIR